MRGELVSAHRQKILYLLLRSPDLGRRVAELAKSSAGGEIDPVEYQPPQERSYLRRLPAGAYRGIAQVHWALTIDDRKRGWLNTEIHLRFREILAHTAFRYGICCPIYCLLPDHLHLLLLGWRDDSDQRTAMRFFRKQLNWVLKSQGFELQKQGYDHVLRDDESSPDGISDVATYIRANPVRAELCEESKDYPFAGCVVPGYPELDVDADDFWERFWKVYQALRERGD